MEDKEKSIWIPGGVHITEAIRLAELTALKENVPITFEFNGANHRVTPEDARTEIPTILTHTLNWLETAQITGRSEKNDDARALLIRARREYESLRSFFMNESVKAPH